MTTDIPYTYQVIVDDVIRNCSELFHDDDSGTSDILQQLKQLWLSKLQASEYEFVELTPLATIEKENIKIAPKRKRLKKEVKTKRCIKVKSIEIQATQCGKSMPELDTVEESTASTKPTTITLNGDFAGQKDRKQSENTLTAHQKDIFFSKNSQVDTFQHFKAEKKLVLKRRPGSQLLKRRNTRMVREFNYIFKNNNCYKGKMGDARVKVILPHLAGHSVEQRTCIINAPCWSLSGTLLPRLLSPLIRDVYYLPLSEATSTLQSHINNSNELLQVDGSGIKVNIKAVYKNGRVNKNLDGDASDLDSDDDVTDDEDQEQTFESKDNVICLYSTVKRRKNVWNLKLHHGIIQANKKVFMFQYCDGDVNW